MRIIQKQSMPQHITVVRNLSPDKFSLLWPKFEQCRYEAIFVADRLKVLERETYVRHSQWQIYKEYRFGEKLLDY